jgi:hypothetical protein
MKRIPFGAPCRQQNPAAYCPGACDMSVFAPQKTGIIGCAINFSGKPAKTPGLHLAAIRPTFDTKFVQIDEYLTPGTLHIESFKTL